MEDVRSYLTSVAPGEGVSQEEVDEILARLSSVGNTGNSGTGSSGTGGSSSIFTKMADSVVQATSPFAGSTENARSLVSWLPSEAQFNANSDKYTVHGEKFTDYKDYILAFIDEEIRSGLTDAEAVWLLDYYGL